MNDAAIQRNLIKALSYRREASFKAVKWKETSFKAFKRGSEISYSLYFTALLLCLLVSSLSAGETELSWQHSPPLNRIKNDWRWNIEAFGWGSSANAAHLPPASSWKANAEGTFGWNYCECSNRLFLRYRGESRMRFRCPLAARSQRNYRLRWREPAAIDCRITVEHCVHACIAATALERSKFHPLLSPPHRAAVNLVHAHTQACTHSWTGMEGRVRKLCLSQRWCTAIWLSLLVQWYFSPEEKLCAVEHLFKVSQTRRQGEERRLCIIAGW